MKAKLKDLLRQPDYAGLDYEDGLQDATVRCEASMILLCRYTVAIPITYHTYQEYSVLS